MAMPKITIAGAGNVGSTCAHVAAAMRLGDIVLIDVVDGLAEGKALDLAEAAGAGLHDCRIGGTTDWAEAAGSDLLIITAGMRRKPGMSRDELLASNVSIVADIAEKAARHCPESILIVVSNPLDAMVHAAAKVSGFDNRRVMGMAGALDGARFCYFVASRLGVSTADVRVVLLGGHGDQMVPLPGYCSVAGIPVTGLLDAETLEAIVQRTRNGGMEVVELLGYSAYYAPAAGAAGMARAVLQDSKSVISCCVYCRAEYNVGGYFVGVPAVLGRGGVERIVELPLDDGQRLEFERSLEQVKRLAARVDELLARARG
jgi:malate dehydrogenase